jgi:hypothetical protein
VYVLAFEPTLLAIAEPLADPVLEVFHGVATDTELDEMQSHDGECIAVREVAKL